MTTSPATTPTDSTQPTDSTPPSLLTTSAPSAGSAGTSGEANGQSLARRILSQPAVAAIAALVLLAAVWEGYKAIAPEQGWSVGETRILPRTTDLAMPHIWSIVGRLFEPITGAPDAQVLWLAVGHAAASSLGVALVGLVMGLVSGSLLALLMLSFDLVGRAVLPLVVLSQTVPLIALAPPGAHLGSRLELGSFTWEPWMSVAVIASYLAFFPVAVGALRGLRSPDVVHLELFRAQAAGWWTTLLRLRLPAAVAYLIPALRLAAANAVIGTVVAEVATGLPGGIGRMIIEFANFAGSDPAKPWAPIIGAILIGLIAAGVVSLIARGLGRFTRGESA